MQEAVFVDKNISAVSSTECKFHCTNGSCLRLDSLICNGLNDCGDNSDEGNCPALTQQPPPAVFTSELEFVQITVVMVVIAVIVVAIICLLNHYKFSTWSLLTRQNEGRMPEDSLQQGTCVWPLDSTATQPASEVRGGSPSLFHLDMCGTLDCPRTQKAATPSLGGDIKVTMCGLRSRERFPAQLFTQCDQPCRFQPTYPYLQHDIDLPPTISLSDGEEPPPYQGPCTLQLRDPEQQMELNRESVRAPPNRTVFDSDLIHVHSAGGLHPPSSHLGISASSGHADGPPPAYSEVMGKCQGSAFLPHQHNYTPLSQQGALKRTIQPSSSRSTMVSVKCGEGCDVKGGLGCLH